MDPTLGTPNAVLHADVEIESYPLTYLLLWIIQFFAYDGKSVS